MLAVVYVKMPSWQGIGGSPLDSDYDTENGTSFHFPSEGPIKIRKPSSSRLLRGENKRLKKQDE